MRKIYLLIAIALIGAASCKKQSFLDDKTSSLIDVNAVFSDSTRTMAFLTRMYEEIPFAFYYDRWEGGNTVQGTDDSEFSLANPVRRSVALYLGNYSAESFYMEMPGFFPGRILDGQIYCLAVYPARHCHHNYRAG